MRAGATLFSILISTSPLTAEAQTLTQQAQCAAQAKANYAEFQAEWKQSPDMELVMSNYETHYNAKLQKCLMLLSMTTSDKRSHTLGETALLYDPYERRNYASYSWIDRKDAPVPIVCMLTPTHTETMYCKTRAEFDSYVANYMDQ